MKALGKNERCPIHSRFNCCGRDAKKINSFSKTPKFKAPVTKVDDEHHPRGYREIRNKAEMKKLLHRKIREQKGLCPDPEMGGCGQPFENIADVVPDHIDPRGNGGAWRDDHQDNIQAMHRWCNSAKGSKRVTAIAADLGPTP
jgi:hypothetical protein